MNGSKPHRKNVPTIIRETYRDFAENTSIHGLKYTVKDDLGPYEKYIFLVGLFWLMVVLAGLCGSGYMTKLFWDRYTSNPTRTSIKTTFAPTTSVPFPAVTICNLNRIRYSKVNDFVKILDVTDADEIDLVVRTLPQLLAFTSPSSIAYNYTDLDLLDGILKRNEFDMKFVMKKISPSCKDMLVMCGWNYTTIPCSDLFVQSLTVQGYCCSFNYIAFDKKGKMKYSWYSGSNSGLKVVVDPLEEDKPFLSLRSTGVEVYIHHPDDYPGMGSISKIVSNGRETFMEIMSSKLTCSRDVKRLPNKQRQCVYPDEYRLSHFHSYADTNCLTECDTNHFYKKCKCVPYYLSFPKSTRSVCNATNIRCLNQARKSSASDILRKCDCPPQCEDDFYSVMSATTSLTSEFNMPSSSFLPKHLLNNNTIVVQVYLCGQRQTILYRDVITSTIYLLSSFGGVYSLFLGCSFITIFEILYYTTLRFVVNLKIFGQIRNERKVPTTHNDNKHQDKSNIIEVGSLKLWQYEFLN